MESDIHAASKGPPLPLGCGGTDGLGGGSGGSKVEQQLVLDVRQTPGHHGPTGRDIIGQHHLHDSVRLLLRRAVPTLSHAQPGVSFRIQNNPKSYQNFF